MLNMYDDSETEFNEGTYSDKHSGHRTRGYYRRMSTIKGKRKRNIVLSIRKEDLYEHVHQYSKNKIHCSCPLCAFNNKKAVRVKGKAITASDLRKIASMDAKLNEFMEEAV